MQRYANIVDKKVAPDVMPGALKGEDKDEKVDNLYSD